MSGTARQLTSSASIERRISVLLRAGVLLSLALVVAGTVLTFVHHPDYLSDPAAVDRLTGADAAFPHTPAQVLAGAADLRGQAIVALGLLVLIVTPVARVAVSIAAFSRQRDRTFATITSVVLALLIISFALGGAGA